MNRAIRVVLGLTLAAVVVVAVALFLRQRDEARSAEERRAAAAGVRTRRIGENHWVVEKAAFLEYLSDLARVTRELAFKPEPGAAQNSVRWLTLCQVAPGSPAYQAGFRLNDRVLKVNGTPIETLDRAVGLVHEVKRLDRLTVHVARGEKTMDYRFDFE